jgi:hypothetical protein
MRMGKKQRFRIKKGSEVYVKSFKKWQKSIRRLAEQQIPGS